MKEAFASLKSKEARNAYTYLNKAEKLYLKAIEEVGARFQKRRIIGIRRLEEGEEVDASPQSEYNGEEVVVQHSRKDSLINRTFPTYKESAGSEANTLATRWAHRADIQAGDQTLISYHDNWYVVQKFDDSDLGYQIMERIAKKDYDKIAEDIKRNGASGRIQSIQRAFTDFAQFDKQRDSARRAESSPHSLQIEHGGENSEVLRDSKTATPRGQTQNDGGGDSKSRRSSKQGLKYSFKEVSESALADLQGERDLALQEEKRTQKVLDSIEGYAEQKEKLYKVLNDKTASDYAVNAAMEEYAQWEKESGYGEAYKANYEASRKANELRREVERMGEELSKKLTAKKFTTEEISGYVQKAIRKFHTTPYLNRASYLLTTGSMLDFSDGQGYRVQDHREISEILNLPDYAEYSTGMIMFMNMGNIRLQTYGIDIAAMPNDKQVSALRGIIQNVMNEYDEFVVDFSKSNGNSDGSITYPQGISSARIISDIKKYFETGVLPEEPSDISRFRYSLKIGDETVGTQGKYNFNTESERVLKDIILQNDIENFLPKGLSKDFIRAIRSYGNFAFPRLYRGMEAAEFENLKKNGYIKSKGEYNFSNQQGETFFSRDVREAFSYATGFAPAGIREKFFEQGQPAYIIEVGNFGDLNFKYNSVKESSTKKEVDTKYITRILELRYNQSDKKVYIKDVGIDGMNSANGEAIHGEPIFVKDKTTGQILYAVQDEEGYETGAYISEAEPGLIVDYNKLKNAPQYEVDFRTKAANISGNEADLIPYVGKGQSIQKGVSSLTSIDRRANSSNRGVVSDNPLSPRNGRGDNQVQRVGEEQSQRGKTQSNRSGDSEGGGQGKQRIKFSLKIGDETLYPEGQSRSDIIQKMDEVKFSRKLPYQSELSQFRYSRKALDDTSKPTYYHLSDGQIKKMLANNTRYKVYSKADAEGIINNVLQNYMSFGEKYGDMSGKTKAQVIDMLWKGLNSAKPGYQMGVALHIADYIIQNSVLESLYGDMENYDVQQALDIIGALKPYLHRINLDSIKGEIKYKYDKDNSAYLLWGERKGESGIGADQIAQELQEKGIQIEAINVADIFFEIDSQYRNAIKSLKKKAKDMLAETLSKEQLKSLRQDIAKEVLRGFDYTGKSSQLAGVLDKYRKQISTLYDKLRDSNRHNRATNRLLDKVQKIKNWKTGAFVNSSKYRTKLFKGSIERLAMIKNRGNLNQSGTRRILAGLAEWYAKDNPILGYVDGENVGHYNEEIASILQAVAQNQKPLTDEQVDLIAFLQEKSGISDYKGLLEWYTKDNLKKGYSAEVKSLLRELASETTFTTEELIALDKVVGYFGHLIENHNKVIRNGKYVDAKPIAERYIDTLQRNKGVKVGWFGKFFDKVFNNGKASYLQTFADPMTVARYMDKYESGFFSEMLGELRDGAIRADVLEMNIRLPLEEFLSKHKKYGKGVSKRTITYHGVEIPALDAFLLYMTLNREQALAGLAEAGFAFNNGKETIRVDGFAKGSEDLTLDELRELARAEQEDLYKQFTEEDKEYISIAEKIFNEDCKETKRATDMLRMGYSNVFEGYYVPIRRANSAVTVDSGTFFDEMNRVSNASFNKDTVRGAKGELYIEGLDEVLDRHIHGISQYASLATVIDQYDILYNVNMTEDANKPQTVRTESENTWAKGNEYFKKLISDVQGISPTRGGGSKLFGFLRSGYAKYQLGLNPKVWLTQLSSIFASSSILDYSSIVKGFGIKSPDVDDYCSLAAVRNNDNSAAMAQSVLDKVDKFGSALMKPIGKVDRFVIKRLFGACQVQVQKESGLKIGTKENKVKAGELLERVILETQQNAMATERSAAMRSGSELMKTITMFTADSMKVFGRVVDSFGEVSVLKHKIKETTDPKAKEALQAQLKAANKKARKSVTALAATAIFMALVAQAFRWLYGKDDDDESVLETMTVDAIGNLMGGLPLIKDLYGALMEGYELNNYAYSAINDLFDAFSSIVNFSEGKPAQKVKNIVYAVGQIFGIPTRNVYNIFYGLTKRFSPTTAYEIDNAFYNKNYSADLQKAIDNDDEDMIATITGIMLDEKVGAIESTTAKKELNSLVAAGYKVLPRSIGNSITYNGEEIALTSRQREQFKSVYSEANSQLASLVEGKAYRSASEEVKAKAIAFIWDIYYNLAIEDLLGVDLETKNTLFAKAIDIPSLAIIVATARGLGADTDKKGNVISGSKKAKVQGYVNSLGLRAAQKYMIMGYLGYSNKNGSNQVRSYIQRLRLSKSEKEKLYEYSGYAA